MRAFIPWLLFAPLLTTTLALPLWQLTRWPWAGWLAGGHCRLGVLRCYRGCLRRQLETRPMMKLPLR